MKNTITHALAFCLLVTAGAKAEPVKWTLSTTVHLDGVDNFISGSFTFDSKRNSASNIEIDVTLNGTTSHIKAQALIDAGYIRIVRNNSIGSPGIWIDRSGLSDAGGLATISSLGAGTCTGLTNGLCDNINPEGAAGGVMIEGKRIE